MANAQPARLQTDYSELFQYSFQNPIAIHSKLDDTLLSEATSKLTTDCKEIRTMQTATKYNPVNVYACKKTGILFVIDLADCVWSDFYQDNVYTGYIQEPPTVDGDCCWNTILGKYLTANWVLIATYYESGVV